MLNALVEHFQIEHPHEPNSPEHTPRFGSRDLSASSGGDSRSPIVAGDTSPGSDDLSDAPHRGADDARSRSEPEGLVSAEPLETVSRR